MGQQLFSRNPAAAIIVMNWLAILTMSGLSFAMDLDPVRSLTFAFGYAVLAHAYPIIPKQWQGSVAAVSITGQAIACTVLFTGHHWQVDSQMWLFAALASTLILKEERAIIVAAGVSMLTVLALVLWFPGLLYFQAGIVETWARFAFQSICVFAECLALLGMTRVRKAMHSHRDAKELALRKAIDSAMHAQEQAETGAKLAERRKAEAETLAQKAQEATVALEKSQQQRLTLERQARESQQHEHDQLEALRVRQTQTLSAIKTGLKHVRNGQLDVAHLQNVPEEDHDLQTDFDSMVDTLKSIVGALGERAQDIGFQAAELNQSEAALSDRTGRQGIRLEEAAGSLQKILTQVEATNRMAREAVSATSSAKSHAKLSGESVDAANNAITKIEASSTEIARITTVIDDIAFQTNLLALNAGIEAVRAGEAGRGFSVVANEVRALAQRSGAAARDISEIVERSSTDVDEGVGHITKTVSVLTDAITSITDAADQVNHIMKASDDQLVRLDEISSAANELDQFTQENTKMIQQSSDSIKKLAQNAHLLRDMTQRFTIDIPDGNIEPGDAAMRPD